MPSTRVADCGIIAPRRNNSAHLHRPWRTIYDPTPEHAGISGFVPNLARPPGAQAISRSRRWPMECGVEGPFLRAECEQFRWSFWLQPGASRSDFRAVRLADVERAQTPHDLVADPGPRNVRIVREFGDRPNECVPIDSRLPGPKFSVVHFRISASRPSAARFSRSGGLANHVAGARLKGPLFEGLQAFVRGGKR